MIVVVVEMAVVDAVRHPVSRDAPTPYRRCYGDGASDGGGKGGVSARAAEEAAPVTAVVPAWRRRLRGHCSRGGAQPRPRGARDGHACAVSVDHLHPAASLSCYRTEVIVPVVQHNDRRRPRSGAACGASLPAPHFGA